jgi:hypothetical protein
VTRLFVVRNRLSPETFASAQGWREFKLATIFSFKGDDPKLIIGFQTNMHENQDLVELVLTPVRVLN